MSCCITGFHCIRPRYEIPQEQILEWLAQAHARAEESKQGVYSATLHQDVKDRLFRLGCGVDKIQNRGVHITDLFEEKWDEMELYHVTSRPEGAGFRERSDFFEREMTPIFEAFYPEKTPLPPHLIHVTCTGYVAPSPAQKLVSLRNAGRSTVVTHAYHMGCYGAISGIRIGMGYLHLNPRPFQVDIVHTELGSLHMHPLKHTTEQLVIQSLFADGFIKYSLTQSPSGPHYKILAIHEETIPDSMESMTWRCEDQGLSMTIAKEVPVLIGRVLTGYLERLLALAEPLSPKKIYYAVHPGGPKILQQVKKWLNLEQDQLQHSHEILRSCGNMSSATLPHVWQKILEDPQVENGAYVISLAFGPGLSVVGGLFEKRY